MLGVDLGTLAVIALALAASGLLTGILAGLFGVGGGAITVPILFEVFGFIGIPDDLRMPLAVGTSLAIIIPTSIQSARGHFAKGALDMALVKAWALPILLGVVLGALVARVAPAAVFQIVFVLVAGINAFKLAFGKAHWRIAPELPGGLGLRAYGFVTGLASALMGIGGGSISNLILTLHGWDIRRSVATSSAMGVLISVPGALGYVWAGWGKAGLPPASLGYVSLLAFVLIVPCTLMTTRFGVALAHSLPRRRLELLFAGFLALVALRFVLKLTVGL